jgi:hypothetical protein
LIDPDRHLVFSMYQKEMNLYLYIPPSSANPTDMLLSLIFGRLQAYWIKTTAPNHHIIKIELEGIAHGPWMVTMVVPWMATKCAQKKGPKMQSHLDQSGNISNESSEGNSDGNSEGPNNI